MYKQSSNSSKEKINYVNNLFTKIAPRYDFMNRILSLGLDQSWRRVAIRKAGFKPGSRILDLGIGTGDMALEVIKQVPDSLVVGLDNCAGLMKLGQRKSGLQSNRLQWVLGQGGQLPFADDSFDGVAAAFSIRNMPELPLVFSEIYRVLAPDGKIVLLDMLKPDNAFSKFIFNCHFRIIIPLLGKWFGSFSEAYSYLPASIENFYSSNELKDILYDLGCEEIVIKHLMFRTVAVCVGTKPN